MRNEMQIMNRNNMQHAAINMQLLHTIILKMAVISNCKCTASGTFKFNVWAN